MTFQSKAMQRRARRWPLHLAFKAPGGWFVTRSSKSLFRLEEHLKHDQGLFPHREYQVFMTSSLLKQSGVDAY